MKKILVSILILFIALPNVKAEDLTPNSKSAILIEATSGEILYQKNVHEKLAPASMTKIMSMLLIMESIDSGKIKYDDIVVVSENASSMGGSQIFLETDSKIRVNELLKGVAIASANDAVVALAEKIAGTETKFVEMMNQRAKELGLKNTNFKNPHGLDDSDHYTTAYDMAMISKELLKHEEILKYTSIYEEYLNKPDGTSTWLVNTNRLVRFYDGVDGLKTGYTGIAGYCLTASAKRNNLRLISVVMKVETSDQRSQDTTKLLNYGFNGFKVEVVLEKDSYIGKVKVENGKEDNVELQLYESVSDLLKVTDDKKEYTYELKVKTIKAPVKIGEKVGTLQLLANNSIISEVPVTVKTEVKKGNVLDFYIKNLKYLFSGKAFF